MTISRKSLANSIDAYDTQIAELQGGKRETFELYRGELFDAGLGKDAVKAEIEAAKKAIRRRQLIAKKSAEVVENADALADEIFAEISAPRAPRATRVETIDEFDPLTGEIAESDLAETRPDGRGKAESASGEAPDTAPQQIQESTEQPSAAAEVTTPEANTHGQTGTADNSGLAASVPANAEAVAKKVGQSEQEAAIELPVDTSAPAVLRAERHNDDPRCLDKAKCGAMSNFAFCMKCRAAWREQHPLEAA